MGFFSAPNDDPDDDQVEADLDRYNKDAEASNNDHDPAHPGEGVDE